MSRALILVADGFHDRDVLEVRAALHGHGFETRTVGVQRGATYKGEKGGKVVADLGYLNVDLDAYRLVVVPGGAAAAAALAAHKSLYNIVYSMLHKGRVAAVVGEGIQVLVAAGSIKQSPNPIDTGTKILRGEIVDGREVAAPASQKAAVEKAGGRCVEGPVAVDGPLVTAVDVEGDTLVRFIEVVVPLTNRRAFAVQ